MGDDGPVASIVAYVAAVEGVGPIMLVFGDVVLLAVQREGAVLDSVDVSPDQGAEERVHCFGVVDVAGSIIVSYDDVAGVACFVVDVNGGGGGAKGDEGRVYALGGDGVWF